MAFKTQKMKIFLLFAVVVTAVPAPVDSKPTFLDNFYPENFNTDTLDFSNNEDMDDYMNFLDGLPVEAWEQFFDNLPTFLN